MQNQNKAKIIQLRLQPPRGALRARWRRRFGAPRPAPSAAPPDMISDYELHAFVDDALELKQLAEVAGFLARHPDAAAEAESYRRQNQSLRALFLPPDGPVPAAFRYLAAEVGHALAREAGYRYFVWLGAGLAVFILAGWGLRDLLQTPALDAFFAVSPH